MNEILYESKCGTCETHKSELGILLSIKKSVEENFVNYIPPDQMKLIIAWFEQYFLDRRTEKIQGFKKQNIKAINK